MKITRELIDNGLKIVHVNYTKKELDEFRDQHDKMMTEIAEMKRKMEEDGIVPPPSSDETPAE